MTSERSEKATINDINSKKEKREDVKFLWIGLSFAAIYTTIIFLLDPLLNETTLLPDQGSTWYFWKLPDRETITMIIVWTFYVIHQLLVWYAFYKARHSNPVWGTKLKKWNYFSLVVNVVFGILHIVQSHIWYDGLAQDVPIWTSQGSVIIMLVMMLTMENKRRGLIAGKSVPYPEPFAKEMRTILKEYHGYIFLWAFTYTFWFHPTVGTMGQLSGFFYLLALLLQGSLMYTKVHLNRYWTAFLEGFVAIHGTLVAIQNGNDLWPMFFFGFMAMVVFTYLYGINIPKYSRWFAIISYFCLVIAVYNFRGWAKINEIIRIPLILWLASLAVALVVKIGLVIWHKKNPNKTPGDSLAKWN